jgi:hypothetical protein
MVGPSFSTDPTLIVAHPRNEPPFPLNRPPRRGRQVLLEFRVVSESNELFQRYDTYKRCMNEAISKTP